MISGPVLLRSGNNTQEQDSVFRIKSMSKYGVCTKMRRIQSLILTFLSSGAVCAGVRQFRLGPGACAVLRGTAQTHFPVQRRSHLLSGQQDAPSALPGGHVRPGQQQARLRLLAVQPEGGVHQAEERHHDGWADDGEDDISQVSREEEEE